jgi:hypothetical protein
VVVSVNDFFKCGIKIGLRLLEKPQRKNKLVTRMKAKVVLADPELVFFMFTINKQKFLVPVVGDSLKVLHKG